MIGNPKFKTPRIISQKSSSLFKAILLTVFFLYVVGSLGDIKAFENQQNLATIKLLLLNVFLFVTMLVSTYYLVVGFLESKLKQNIFIVGILVVSMFLAYKIISFPTNELRYLGLSYILVGDYLRDIHGINIYFMDWGGWLITTILYLTAIFSSLVLAVIKRFSPKLLEN